jgi:aminopeptidase-like protein
MTILLGLNLSEGHHSLTDIGEQACMPFEVVQDAAEILLAHKLLQKGPV